MTEQQREVLKRAIKMLREEALGIQQGHTLSGNWGGEEEAKSAHDEMLAVASQLEALSHAEGEAVPVAEITIDRHGDAHFKACPNYLDLDQGTYQLYTHPAPQVAGLTETAIKSSPAYRALHREKEHLLGLLKDQAPQVAVPEGFTVVPVREFYVMSEDEDIIGGIGNDFEAGKHLLKLAQEGDPEKAWGLVADIDQTKLAAAPTAPAGELVTRCTAGLGCDEKGHCDAAATGQGDLCDRRTMAHEQPVSDPDGLPGFECPECGGESLEWQYIHNGPADVADGRLRLNEVSTVFFLGCADCSETARTVGADEVCRILSAPAPDEREIAALALERHADNLIVMAERDGRNSDRESQQTWEEAAYFAKQEAARLRAGKEGE